MGSVFNRGTRHEPLWYGKYKEASGVWKTVPTKQPSAVEAKKWIANIEARIANGQVGRIVHKPEDAARKTITIAQLVAKYREGFAPISKNVATYWAGAMVECGRFVRLIGDRAASSLTEDDTRALVADLSTLPINRRWKGKRLSPGSVAAAMIRLGQVIGWGIKAGLVDCINHVVDLELPETERPIHYLNQEECSRLLSHVRDVGPPGTFEMVSTAIGAGLRKGELFGLRWANVRFEDDRIDVIHSFNSTPKSGRGRQVPMVPALSALLLAWRDRCPPTTEGLVFPVFFRPRGAAGTVANIEKNRHKGKWAMGCHRHMATDGDERVQKRAAPRGLTRYMQDIGIDPSRTVRAWHLLRHTCATLAIESGVSLFVVQKVLGHASPVMSMRYAQVTKKHMTSEFGRFALPAVIDPLP